MLFLSFSLNVKINSYIWLDSLLSPAAKLISRTAEECHVRGTP